LATKRGIISTKQNLVAAESAIPFDSERIVEAEDELDAAERGLKALEAIKARLFPAE
jgi:hypothetical protein